MTLVCVRRQSPAYPALAVALCVLLIFLPGCAARKVQQDIDTLQAHARALLHAVEVIRLDKLRRNAQCQGAHEAFVALLRPPLPTEARQRDPPPADPAVQAVLDYVRYAYSAQQYMETYKVSAEIALA